jgi:hypothetical protein
VKLNSADFQRGGFAQTESQEVARMLEAEGIDFLEVSGGTYEQPRMMDSDGLSPGEARSARREAYFLAEAERLRAAVATPLMVTGGFRTAAAMEAALAGGACDLIGLARPMCVEPDAPARLLCDPQHVLPAPERTLRLGPGPLSADRGGSLAKMLNGFGVQAWFCLQLLRISEGQAPQLELPVWRALWRYQQRETAMAKALRR